MHHADIVNGPQGGQYAQADSRRLGGGHRPVFGNGVAQRPERHEFHDDGGPVALFHNVIDADDVRVTEPRGQLRFPHRAPARGIPLNRVHLIRPDDFLDGDIPVEQLIARPPDNTHRAAADNGI